MKTRKFLAIVATMVFAMIGSALAEEVTYRVKMTGVTWNGCKASVGSAFRSLDGVKTVEVKAGKQKGTQMVIVKGTKSGLTKDQAIKSLGSKAKRFVVKEWKEAKAGAGKKKEEKTS